nr:hypothetical protein [Thaumasiovibrio occultus]
MALKKTRRALHAGAACRRRKTMRRTQREKTLDRQRVYFAFSHAETSNF